MLLGPRGAAEDTHARADAAPRVAVEEVAGPAQGLGPAPHDSGVAPGELGRDLCHVESALDAAEVRLERRLGQRLQAEALAPQPEHRRRRAKAGAGVHERGAADGAAERQHDRRGSQRRRLAGVAVEAHGHVARAGGELVRLVPVALLEHRGSETIAEVIEEAVVDSTVEAEEEVFHPTSDTTAAEMARARPD